MAPRSLDELSTLFLSCELPLIEKTACVGSIHADQYSVCVCVCVCVLPESDPLHSLLSSLLVVL